jgi:MscS family membrane protein
MSDAPEGNRKDASRADVELVTTLDVAGKSFRVELQQTEQTPELRVWLFSSATVAAIPSVHSIMGESAIEKHLPEALVKTRFMNTALWQWIALIALLVILRLFATLLWRVGAAVSRRIFRQASADMKDYGVKQLVGPVGLLIGVAAYGAAVALIAPSALVRFYLSRILTLLAFMAIAWILMRLLDILSRRLHIIADPRQQALYSSVMPLGLRVVKITIFTIALITTFSTWGYNTSTIWATLGVGSLAVALAAQKTLENFFGGVSVIGDRPVLVGDFCRVGSMVGTVEDIGLRSTRIRTLDRTLVTVPNSQFSTMTLENFAKRDRMWFHPTFAVRCDAMPDQVRTVMASFESILRNHPEVDAGTVPVRFTGIGEYAYNLEIFAYVLTPSFDRFLVVQTELLLKMIDAIEQAGTALAVPVRELIGGPAQSPVQIGAPVGQDGQAKQLR